MRYKKQHPDIVAVGVPEPPPPNSPDDHLAGQHYESFMSQETNASKFDYPETPMRAAINGNNVWDDMESDWIARSRGEEVAKRRDWLEHRDPGGKTWKKGSIL